MNPHTPSREDLATLLDRHPSLTSLIPELRQHLRQHFGESHIVLRTSLDDLACSDKLVVEVHTPLAPMDALHALDRFDESWWLDASLRYPVETIVDTRLV